jgi:hypothetical protein
VPFDSYNYVQRLFDRYGVAKTRSFVRTFFFPDLGHVPPTLTGQGSALGQLVDQEETHTGTQPGGILSPLLAGPGSFVARRRDGQARDGRLDLCSPMTRSGQILTAQHRSCIASVARHSGLTASPPAVPLCSRPTWPLTMSAVPA